MTYIYRYGNSIIRTNGGVAGNSNCCCDNNPPPPNDCALTGGCDYFWGFGEWVGLSAFCNEGCQCGPAPNNPPGPEGPFFINVPCEPIN